MWKYFSRPKIRFVLDRLIRGEDLNHICSYRYQMDTTSMKVVPNVGDNVYYPRLNTAEDYYENVSDLDRIGTVEKKNVNVFSHYLKSKLDIEIILTSEIYTIDGKSFDDIDLTDVEEVYHFKYQSHLSGFTIVDKREPYDDFWLHWCKKMEEGGLDIIY